MMKLVDDPDAEFPADFEKEHWNKIRTGLKAEGYDGINIGQTHADNANDMWLFDRPAKPAAAAAGEDLTSQLQQSVDQAHAAKGLQPGAPRFVYRARDVGDEGVPLEPHSSAQATSDFGQARKFAEPGQRSSEQGQVVRIDLSQLKPTDYVVKTHPDGMKWVRFTRPLSEDEVTHFAGAGQAASKVH
jgi:hypothetical protein